MSDEEWAFFERIILAVRAPNGRKPTNHRLVLGGVFWIARTGAPWRDLPEEFGKWSSVYRQFRRWTRAGLLEDVMDALNQSGAVPDFLQMVDSTVVRARHQAAGAIGGHHDRVLAAQERPMGKQSTGLFSGPSSTSRPRSTSASMQQACP
ncbi:IS5 family transposase [Salipiger sp. HF18]|uniref:IS5 family transposase n=1 Tax=Salipiger sp. HF18 TaxID=2721557 RepID=UPI0020CB5967|nr:IS5 family transposase [Salipiger sp. HF18]